MSNGTRSCKKRVRHKKVNKSKKIIGCPISGGCGGGWERERSESVSDFNNDRLVVEGRGFEVGRGRNHHCIGSYVHPGPSSPERFVARVWVWYRLRRVLVGGEVVLVVLVVLVMEEEKWGATN